jgi:hypothetical protein
MEDDPDIDVNLLLDELKPEKTKRLIDSFKFEYGLLESNFRLIYKFDKERNDPATTEARIAILDEYIPERYKEVDRIAGKLHNVHDQMMAEHQTNGAILFQLGKHINNRA